METKDGCCTDQITRIKALKPDYTNPEKYVCDVRKIVCEHTAPAQPAPALVAACDIVDRMLAEISGREALVLISKRQLEVLKSVLYPLAAPAQSESPQDGGALVWASFYEGKVMKSIDRTPMVWWNKASAESASPGGIAVGLSPTARSQDTALRDAISALNVLAAGVDSLRMMFQQDEDGGVIFEQIRDIRAETLRIHTALREATGGTKT